MKKKLYLVLALVVAVSLVFAACNSGGNNTTTPPPASGGGGSSSSGGGSTPAPPPADTGKKYQVDISMTHGEPVSPNWLDVAMQLQEMSGGRLEVTVFWSGSLLPMVEIPRGMQNGAATFTNLPSSNFHDVVPLNTRILSLPFFGMQNPVESCEIYMQLLDEFPQMREEMAQFRILPLGATPLGMYSFHFTDPKPVHKPEDLKGKSIIPYSTAFLPLLEANNAAGDYFPPAQAYESLEKGVVDGYINSWAFAGWFGLTDLVRSHTNFGEFQAYQEFNIFCLNMDFYESLPEDLRQVWHDAYWNNGGYKQIWQDTSKLYYGEIDKAKAKNDTIVDLTPEEIAVWREILAPEHRKALDKINAARGDKVADQIYDRAREILKQKYGV